MSDKIIEEQIREINRKLDLLLDDSIIQKQNREAINDLVDDVAVIGKDVFRNAVTQLDNAGVELDGENLRDLGFRVIRNVNNMGMVLEMLESLSDLAKDATPIVRQIGLDGVKKFHEFEQKGYFEILNQIGIAMDTIVSSYSREDLNKLSENLVQVFDTLSIVSDKKVLEKIDAIFSTLRDIKTEDVEEFSIWRIIKDFNKPEFKKSLGFMMAFLELINEKNKNQIEKII
ncbi:MAG TPA: hypothetical protein VMV47_11465 [Bacteroidales bacterium]|nr:hypothetical protein [Bacteroidales bacterium]